MYSVRLRGLLSITIALAALAAWTATAVAGAWVKKPGEYYFKLSSGYLYSTERYNSDGDVVPIDSDDPNVLAASYTDINVTAYLEYGMAERVTLVASLPWKITQNAKTEFSSQFDAIQETDAVNGGVTDLRIGARLPLKSTGFPVAFESLVKLPLGYDPSPPQTQLAPLGSGAVDLEFNLLAGASLWPFPGYVNASAGYRVRGAGLDDELMASFESGVSYGAWFGKAALDAQYTRGDLIDADPTKTVTNENILKLLAEINYNFTARFAVSVEAFHVLQGANTVAGTTWVAGVIYQQKAGPPR
jgi:hypothetical protein